MMKKFWSKLKKNMQVINFDGLRCTIKGDPSIREMIDAFKKQKEIDNKR